MINNKIEKDEVIISENTVRYGKENVDGKLVITNKNLIFYSNKGIFWKKLKIDKKILISNIKMHKDNVSIKQNNKSIMIQTTSGDIIFECKNILEASKIVNKIKDLRTDLNVIERAYKKYDNFKTSDVGKALIGAGTTWLVTHPKQTVKGVKTIGKFIQTLFIRK